MRPLDYDTPDEEAYEKHMAVARLMRDAAALCRWLTWRVVLAWAPVFVIMTFPSARHGNDVFSSRTPDSEITHPVGEPRVWVVTGVAWAIAVVTLVLGPRLAAAADRRRRRAEECRARWLRAAYLAEKYNRQ